LWHRIDRQKQKKTTEFENLHHQYIAEWDLGTENIILTDEPHTNYNFRVYLSWYLGATRAKLKGQWTEADYGDIQSSDDEDTSYDLATRSGTLVEAAPILDRVVSINSSCHCSIYLSHIVVKLDLPRKLMSYSSM